MASGGIPEIQDTSVNALKLYTLLGKALPAVQNVSSDPLVGYSTKAADAAQLAYETGLAFGETRANLKRNKLVSQGEDRAIEQGLKSMEKDSAKRMRAQQRNRVNNRNRLTDRFAGEILGVGNDVYKRLKYT